MQPFPETEQSLVLRTDFSDDAAWQSLCAAIEAPVGDLRAYVELVSDPAFDGLTLEQVLALHPQDAGHTFIFIVDQRAISDPEYSILVVDLYEELGRTFRVIPSAMWGVENNLSLANMDFFEFAEAVDSDGVFRGFGDI